jgi:superfamily II DNA or RNA helicase
MEQESNSIEIWPAIHPSVQYPDILQENSFRLNIASTLKKTATNPEAFGVDVKWRETQIQMILETAMLLENGHKHFAFEIPTGVGKSMLLGAYLRAFFDAYSLHAPLSQLEAILFTSRANLVLQLAGNRSYDHQDLVGESKVTKDEIEQDDDEDEDPATNWGDVKQWISPVIGEESIRLITGQTELSERQKDAALTVMTYQGFTTIPQNTLTRTRQVGLLMFDEAHRISSRVREDINALFPHAFRLGGSATMQGPPSSRPFEIFDRIKRKGKEDFHSQLAYHASLPDAIERKELKTIRCLQKGVAIDLSDITRTTTGNLNQKELTRKMMYNIPVLAQFIQETFQERHPVLELAGAKPVSERTIIASVKRIAIAMKLSKICNEEFNIPANWTSGTDSKEVFRRKIQALARGKIRILFSAGKLGEGLDVSEVDAVMSLWPYDRASAWVLKQLIGRGLRLHDNDQDCLVIEPIFDAGAHNLATTPELFNIQENYPGVLLAPAAERQVEMKIIHSLNNGELPHNIWDTLSDTEKRSAGKNWEHSLTGNAGNSIPTIPLIRNERHIKNLLRQRRKGNANVMTEKELAEEAIRQVEKNGLTVECLAGVPAVDFIKMSFGPFDSGLILFNDIAHTHVPILLNEHMQQLERVLSSFRQGLPDNKSIVRVFTLPVYVDSIKSMVTPELMKNAEAKIGITFQEDSWNYMDSSKGMMALLQDISEHFDLLKKIVLNATDPALFKIASQLFKAAKICRSENHL